MFLIVTRNFPPDIGGMQFLMGGLSEGLVNHGPVKVFTFDHPNSESYDKNSSLNIERIKGIKLFRKYRIANLANKFIAPASFGVILGLRIKSLANFNSLICMILVS